MNKLFSIMLLVSVSACAVDLPIEEALREDTLLWDNDPYRTWEYLDEMDYRFVYSPGGNTTTLKNTIFLSKDRFKKGHDIDFQSYILRHEIVHARQWRKVENFPFRYNLDPGSRWAYEVNASLQSIIDKKNGASYEIEWIIENAVDAAVVETDWQNPQEVREITEDLLWGFYED